MACLLVSAAEAVVITVVEKIEEKREKKEVPESAGKAVRIPMSRKLKWLICMLFGGAVLLAFEHIWHGEIVPWFPFLTAMSDPADMAEMFNEMATVGVTMAGLTTVVWIGICVVADFIVKRQTKKVLENT